MKIGPSCARSAIRRASSRSSGVKSIRSSTVMPCRSNAAGLVGNRLGRRVLLPRHGPRRDRPLLDRPHRLAGHAVEDVHEGLLAGLGDRLDVAPVDPDVEQVAGGRKVVVPEAVVHRLEVPDPLSGLDVDGDDALREQVVAGAHAPVPVVRRRPRRQIDVAQLLVDGHRAPHVGVAAVAPRLVLPRLGPELAALGNGVEDPLHLAGPGVEGADVTGVRLPAGQGGVLDDAAHDDGVADDGQRLRVGQARSVDRTSEAAAQIDGAVGPEVRIQAAGAGVHGDEQQVVGRDEDARVTARVVLPVRHPAMLPAHVGGAFEPIVGAGVVRPDQLAGAGVERRHLPEGGARVDQSPDHQRGGLERTGADRLVAGRDLGRERPPSPGDLQLGEVLRRDLVQRRVLGVGRVRPERPPLAHRSGGLRRGRRRRDTDHPRHRHRTRRLSQPQAHVVPSLPRRPQSPSPGDRGQAAPPVGPTTRRNPPGSTAQTPGRRLRVSLRRRGPCSTATSRSSVGPRRPEPASTPPRPPPPPGARRRRR